MRVELEARQLVGDDADHGPSGTSGGHVAIPAKATPSISAKMICETEVKNDLSSLLGVQPTQPLAPTWKDHVYSCTYHYKGGTLTLAVKELTDKASTDAYFARAGAEARQDGEDQRSRPGCLHDDGQVGRRA